MPSFNTTKQYLIQISIKLKKKQQPNAERISNTQFECGKQTQNVCRPTAEHLKKKAFSERMALRRRRSRPQCLSRRETERTRHSPARTPNGHRDEKNYQKNIKVINPILLIF
ncbi:hypothetical protein B5X24_HaOG203180 [Helicoverpa armigera]|uniref:Uncharacterized protein n=1 Tax=Helicoverpa armigera TaxID=29058 RepID=A0A2W1BWG9_HELAM|nr:hypothetical protein B5X24_HaOG203180 [Helicoverpa armigera]